MKTSESLINISKALAEAQKKISHATKDSKNPHFRNDYASLESVIDATKNALLEHGIFVIQSVDEKKLVTRIQHSSGEYFESSLEMILQKNDMQGLGSAITYARRYSLASMLNISQADDDGNEASKQQQPKPETKKQDAQARGKVDLNSYIIQEGRDTAGKKLSEFSIEFHEKKIADLEAWLKDGKPLKAGTREYLEYAKLYVSENQGLKAPTIKGDLFID